MGGNTRYLTRHTARAATKTADNIYNDITHQQIKKKVIIIYNTLLIIHTFTQLHKYSFTLSYKIHLRD